MMAKLIALDDGHGMETAGKRTPHIPELGRFIHENEFNRAVVGFLDEELRRCGFNTLLVAPGDGDTSLSARTNLANSRKADAFISIHYNAFDGNFDGYDPEGLSVHIYPGSKDGRKLAEAVLKYLKSGTSQKNRGIVENNFHVLRETNMVAILSENGFMDNKREALLMQDVNFQKEVAREHAQGICDYFNVRYVEETKSSAPAQGAPIVTKATATVAQAKTWAKNNGATDLFISLAEIFWRIAVAVGINPVLVYAQSAKETGFGNFKGVLDDSFKNPCGLKTKAGGGNSDPNAHQRFATWEEGIEAQIDHLALYAGASGYPKVGTPDPRHFPYLRGKAPTVEALGGNWAPSNTYGSSIVTMMKKLESTKAVEVPAPPAGVMYYVQTGAYSVKANAEAQLRKVKAAGFDAMLKKSGNMFKIQVGAFSIKANADLLAAKLKASGFDTYVTTSGGTPVNVSTKAKTIEVGSKVTLKESASKYSTGQTIPSWVKGKTYTVQQLTGQRALLKEIVSWVDIGDLTME